VSAVPELDPLLSGEGWPYASSAPVEAGDPGRFHALFGRDSLITSLQVLPAAPEVAAATLRALAARQGRRDHPGTLEEPGKIGHEFRPAAPESFVAAGWPDRGPFAYYGTADATSWFLVVLAATRDADLVRELDAAWRAAGGWLAGALERGGGLVRHEPGTWPALSQQGWRDCVDPVADGNGGGILRPNGTAPKPPLADADSQAVAHAALRALAALDPGDGWEERAGALRERLSALYGPDVMAIEAGDAVVGGAGSQLGWLLWAGALEGDAREAAAERLCAPDVLTGFGLRTLSSESPVFAPDAYHRGSVWPFDSWLGWGGLRAAGRADEAEAVRTGVLEALDRLGRAPELYAVSRAGELDPVPVANRVQAWTVGAHWALLHSWDGWGQTPSVAARA
jgi:glycogen debranching enzyme